MKCKEEGLNYPSNFLCNFEEFKTHNLPPDLRNVQYSPPKISILSKGQFP